MVSRALWAERFAEHLAVRGRAPRTVETYCAALGFFLDFLESCGLASLSELNSELLEAYRVHLMSRRHRGRPLSLSYQAGQLAGVKAFLRFLARAGHLPLDLGAELELPRVPRSLPRVILTEPEVRQLLERPDVDSAMGVRNRALLELLYGTALRNAELIGLKLHEVELERRLVRVERGKGGKSRVVPLGEEARYWLSEYLQRARPLLTGPTAYPHVFLTSRQQPFCGQTLTVLIRTLARSAGLTKNVTPHVLRHSCATHMLRRGAGLRQLQKLLGHETPNSTQIYTHVEVSDLRRTLERCHPRERKE